MVKKENKPNSMLRLIVVSSILIFIIICCRLCYTGIQDDKEGFLKENKDDDLVIPFYDSTKEDQKEEKNIDELIKKPTYRDLAVWVVYRIENKNILATEASSSKEHEKITRQSIQRVQTILIKGKKDHTEYIKKTRDRKSILSLCVNEAFFNSKCIEYMLIKTNDVEKYLRKKEFIDQQSNFICSEEGDKRMFEWLFFGHNKGILERMLKIIEFAERPFIAEENESVELKEMKKLQKDLVQKLVISLFNNIAWNPTLAVKNKIIGASNRQIENILDECINSVFKTYYILEDLENEIISLEHKKKVELKNLIKQKKQELEEKKNLRKYIAVKKITAEETLLSKLTVYISDLQFNLALFMNIYIRDIIGACKDAKPNASSIVESDSRLYNLLIAIPMKYYVDSTVVQQCTKTIHDITQSFNSMESSELDNLGATTKLAKKVIDHAVDLQKQQERNLGSILYLIDALLGKYCCSSICEGIAECLIEAVSIKSKLSPSQIQLVDLEFEYLVKYIAETRLKNTSKSFISYVKFWTIFSSASLNEMKNEVRKATEIEKLRTVKEQIKIAAKDLDEFIEYLHTLS